MTHKDLGPLEFQEEDGFLLMDPTKPRGKPWNVISIDEANRLLAERLSKTPEVEWDVEQQTWVFRGSMGWKPFTKYVGCRARLIIEKLEGK